MTTRLPFTSSATDGRPADTPKGSGVAPEFRSPWAAPDGGAAPSDPAGYPRSGPTPPAGPAGPPAAPSSPAGPPPPTGQPDAGPGDPQRQAPWWGAPWTAPQLPPPGPPRPPGGGPGGGPSFPGPPPYGQATAAQPRPPSANRRRLIAGALALALASAGVGGGVGALVAGGDSTTVVSSAGLQRSTDSSGGTSPAADNTVAKAAQKILPSVVTIAEESRQESGIGSGVVIRSDGYILTNNHVVSGAANGGTLNVTLQDGRTFNATVVGTDPSSDLAVVKIGAAGLTAATFGNSDALSIGELVVAVGSPLGMNGTVTSGIVSAVHRPVRTGDSTVQNDQNAVLDAIQTDAPINPGNSGGPLVNSKGEIIGVNSAIATVNNGGSNPFGGGQDQSGNIGVGFAIPGNYASSIASQLISTGRASHPYLGVNASTAGENGSPAVAGGTGAQIRSLVAGGPAEQAGLQAGDVITKLADRKVTNVDSLIAAVRSHAIGDQVTVAYTRNGENRTATVRLAKQPG
jgi:putative serine protease PepD